MKFYFRHDQLSKVTLYIQSEVVELSNVLVGSLSSLGPEGMIIARQNHLHKVWIVKFTIFIRVEEFNQVVAISLCHVVDAIVTEEV